MYVSALSVWQPWATLLVTGLKKFETRSWPTNFRGSILIHAGKAKTQVGETCFYENQFDRNWHPQLQGKKFAQLPFGAFVGKVDIVGCSDTTELLEGGLISPEEFKLGDYSVDRFGWTCVEPMALAVPVAWSGRQKIFNVGVDISIELRDAIKSLGVTARPGEAFPTV